MFPDFITFNCNNTPYAINRNHIISMHLAEGYGRAINNRSALNVRVVSNANDGNDWIQYLFNTDEEAKAVYDLINIGNIPKKIHKDTSISVDF